MFNPFKQKKQIEKDRDFDILDYELISRLFGTEEARKSLLNVLPPQQVTSDMVLSDSAALENMMGNKGWSIFEKAVWFKLLTSLRLSLASKTIEERESARSRVLAHLEVLHLPYEMRYSADNIRKMKELENSVKELSK